MTRPLKSGEETATAMYRSVADHLASGPPPRGCMVLFRSDDPSIWNTDSPGENFALPVRRAHSKIRYLRLKRLDTDEMLIVPITHRQLTLDERTDSFPGHWWNGTARQEWGARHLGIAQVPSSSGYEKGLIGVTHHSDRVYSGSGFGWKTRVDDKQYYSWQGREIPPTVFEVAVTAGPLTEEERRWFTGPDPQDDPPPGDWTILFRSNDPSVWNTFSTGEQFAIPVSRAHAAIRYLRLTRLDTGEALILPITRKQLAREDRPNPARGYWWNGSGAVEYNSRHLGIVQVPPAPARVRGVIGVTGDGFNAFVGSGFGSKCLVDDGTYCCWRGQEIPKTTFEIAVTTVPLAEDEKHWLVE